MKPQNLINISPLRIMYLQVIILFFITTILLETKGTVSALGSHERDRLALLEFKKGIADDPLGVLRSWNDSTDFCNWHGVSCSRRHQRVTALNLSKLNLQGNVSTHIGNLTFLRNMNLSENRFYGKIPPEVGLLFRLQYLSLEKNTFIGEIPVQLSNCSQLRFINLWWNNLVGRILPELGSLTKLETIYLDSNNLRGSIPPSIGNLSSLVSFVVPYNNLDGSIPDVFHQLKSLSNFDVTDNELSGIIPASFYNLSSITSIGIADNKLNSTFPASIGHTLPNLEWLAIGGNYFSGQIPVSLSNASKLELIDLSDNNFVGVVPGDLGNLVNLWRFSIANNYLRRNSANDLDFLASLKNNSRLQLLDFSGNQFEGVLPSSIANLSSLLNKLYLRDNKLSGVIPATLEKYTNLQVLNMAGNLFTSIIPSSFGMFQNMEGMFLGGNKLFGQIPFSFGNLTKLNELDLSKNNLNGAIPPNIGNCKSLQYLEISENSLTGAIPKVLFDLSSLSLLLLNLSHNSLVGNLPREVGNLYNINSLDFSRNNLSGEIPTSIRGCQSLEYLNLQDNSFQGVIPSSLAALKGLTYLDISQNNLSGNIPKDIQNLQFLLYFNASFNNLEGEMPTKGVFGNASAVSVMGNNKLCGGVPKLKLPECLKDNETKKGNFHAMKLIIVGTSVVLCLLLFSITVLTLYWNRILKKTPSREDQDPFHLPRISYKMLYDGTGRFSLNNLIGTGSFGFVYKGILDQNERVVAVKVLNLQNKGASKSFMAECLALRNIRHRNLVKIITSCSSIDHQGNDFKALVYEYMENSSLEEWLHMKIDNERQLRNLNFLQSLNVAIDVASALHYLHFECTPPIVHCDLKPSNVLLDNDMVAHVGDFGLARILSAGIGIPQNESTTIGLKGSIGYVAPEYGMGGEASSEGDVYSYGVLLLEMFTGKRPTDEIFKEDLNVHQFLKD